MLELTLRDILQATVEFLEVVSPALTIVSLLLAVWALHEARSQSKTAAAQSEQLAKYEDRLHSIWGSLSTRYLGQFPGYGDEIAKLIGRAKDRVTICCDLPGYGILSNRAAWIRIQQAIQLKVEQGVSFDVTFYGERRREQVTRDQIDGVAGGLDDWLASAEMRLKLAAFVKDYGQVQDIEDLTAEDYLGLSRSAQKQVLVEAYRGVDVNEIDSEIPLYFWIVDDEDAIISIPIFSDRSTEHGFRTSDQAFIAALKDLKTKYLRPC